MRRVRDLVRAAILRRDFPHGALPGESELMLSHGVGRASVRAALALLRDEGLIERTQGIGTHVVVRAVTTRLDEAHGAAEPGPESLLNRRMRPKVLDCSTVALPATAANRLGVPAGVPCLRLEYIALLEDEPIALATNYALFPEAERLATTPFVSDWYALLAEAGIVLGDSEFLIGGMAADALTARLLDLVPGTPLLALEQVISDPSGRAFDYAVVLHRTDRFLFRSVAHRPNF
ncbi:MAG TPA: GntR family transcriptional regulator [Pseudonocardiaceae bacterium]|nr:GntR family transcriptional regulator [Pseudonocardiaceae bacterium]